MNAIRVSIWQIVLGLCLVSLASETPVAAQQWTGTASLGLSGGYQTNAYLHPVAGTWDSSFDPAFVALAPHVGLTRNSQRTRFDLTAQSLLYPRRDARPQFALGSARLRVRLGSNWTLGTVGGATRYRLTVARDGWWALPTLRWTPTSETMLTLRAGMTQRIERTSDPTVRQLSGLASLRATYWVTDRMRAGLRLYRSDGRTAAATETGYGGTGGSLSATYWPNGTVSVTAHVSAEQARYQNPSDTEQDQVGRLGLSAEWEVHSSVAVFGHVRGLHASLASADAPQSDVHASGGVRVQLQRVLGGSTASPSRRFVCNSTDEGLHFRVPYEGDGTPHVTGSFTGWSLPGIPLKETQSDVWSTTVDLPPGRYTYRIRVVEDDAARWLSLPSYARTDEDSFGGTNGVCIVS